MRKDNNFDFLRFLFAVFVVLSHAYPLSGIDEKEQWIYKMTNGQIVLAQIGLSVFFVISGFFIFQSMERSKSLLQYYKKRMLRLFPALLVLLLITVVVVPFVYTGVGSVFSNSTYLSYLPNNISLFGFQGVIDGVFDTNHYKAINGSLWTIRYEFTLYIVISFLFFIRTKQKLLVVLLALVFILFSVLYLFFMGRFSGSSILGMQGYHILNLGNFFIAGSLLASLKFEKYKSKSLLFVLILILILSLYFDFYDGIKHLIFSMFIIILGYTPIKGIKDFGKIGDLSYGIYIYSFFIQQLLMWFFKLNTINLAVYSLLISVVLAYLSWHLVEKSALRYK
ncbi:acyltransferase family protein [Algibacter sp. L3A6]|uniref:acyltransferase family protein n=1 Tax=Algibacter sp. L3A6 TaxID=2686366 RepID=UPI00131D957E|nr:acyltransferase [Algibacter sp. L3A6]